LPTNAPVRSAAGAHLVQFYEHDDELAARVVGYLHTALSAGNPAVVIATPEHREMFAAQLAQAGWDLDEARNRGALLEFDAADTLAQLVVDGTPNATRFDQVVGSVVRAAAARGPRVAAFGEMVALLWEAGSVARAIELEELWNELCAQVPLALFCAYPHWLTQTDDGITGYAEVCTAHSHVVAAAPPPTDADVTRRFPKSTASPGAARRFVSDWLTARGHTDVIDTAQLAVSELATNALVHAQSDFTVSLVRVGDIVRISVGDRSADAPVRQIVDDRARCGRGLAIVAALVRAFGHEFSDDGKFVWADLAIAPQPGG
jgi:anti-sigma regulatory factor (Ser/Thr protein kinase)